MKQSFFKMTMALSLMALLFISCKKDKDKGTEENITSDNVTSESNSAQAEFDDILKLSEDALQDQNKVSKIGTINAGCPTITLTTPGTSGVIEVDFGTACVGNDAKIRSGKLIVTYSGLYRSSGTVVTIKTKNYYVNGKRIDGKRTVTNTGNNASGNLLYTVVDTDTAGTANSYAKITDTDQKITTWRSNRTREFVAGTSTLSLLDDEYLINGTADGVSKEGNAFSMTADNIRIKIECWASRIFFPVSGTLSITAADGTRSINYGTGDCDKTIAYTHTSGKTYTITLGY